MDGECMEVKWGSENARSLSVKLKGCTYVCEGDVLYMYD